MNTKRDLRVLWIMRSTLFLVALTVAAIGWGLVFTDAPGSDDIIVGIPLVVLGMAAALVILRLPILVRPDMLDWRYVEPRRELTVNSSGVAHRALAAQTESAESMGKRWKEELALIEPRLLPILRDRSFWQEMVASLDADDLDPGRREWLDHYNRIYLEGQVGALERFEEGPSSFLPFLEGVSEPTDAGISEILIRGSSKTQLGEARALSNDVGVNPHGDLVRLLARQAELESKMLTGETTSALSELNDYVDDVVRTFLGYADQLVPFGTLESDSQLGTALRQMIEKTGKA